MPDTRPSIFFSLLGTGDYLRCRYRLDDRTSEPANYALAALTTIAPPPQPDSIRVACTREAADKHWDGLAKALATHRLPDPVPLEIPAGATEAQLWSIFETLVDAIPADSDVQLDLTHSFRSLPVLVMMVLQYLKVVKHVRVRGIYYGAFEALGSRAEVAAMPETERIVPVFDLTPFVSLFDWSTAVHGFLRFGRAEEMKELVDRDITPVLRRARGRNQTARALRCAVNQVADFARSNRYVRGRDIAAGRYHRNIVAQIDRAQENLVRPLQPLLDELRAQFGAYEDQTVRNGIRAAGWCLDNGMIQQAATLLQECVITRLQEKMAQLEQLKSEQARRELLTALLSVVAKDTPESEWAGILAANRGLARECLEALPSALPDIFARLTQLRNDLNHGGFVDHPADAESLKKRLAHCRDRIAALLLE